MNPGNFKKWVSEKRLPNLQRNSVIYIDNEPYHTTVENRTPTKYSTKKTNDRLTKINGIPNDDQMRKAELLSLIGSSCSKEIVYKEDNLIEKEGHEVIRLPSYHCDLNTIEFVRSSVKRKV
ncbi:DDE_3 domain-containing protein [Nephila pilipes]|uniref:DDE_3 domain-containing protein n=1 Tax=Nephila pilipes TaxID=299642 RepID=A0A8X6PTD1_NEPPI|nr:DDE_3 domain-containing protein [Nephila pilipes]